MCGIFGLAATHKHGFTQKSLEQAVQKLFILSETRGKEAAGIALATPSRLVIHKDSIPASKMLHTADYKAALYTALDDFFTQSEDAQQNGASIGLIGHSRLVTNGVQGIEANNQPICRDNAVIVHNGIVVNVDALWADNSEIQTNAEVDSEVIAALIEQERRRGKSLAEALHKTFNQIKGEASVALLFKDLNVMVLATNTGSLYTAKAPSGDAMFFASEAFICKQLTEGPAALPGFEHAQIHHILHDNALIIDLDTMQETPLSLSEKCKMPQVSTTLGLTRKLDDSAQKTQDALLAMRRCTRCILPETMPYIQFDDEGVCNYCHNYQPVVSKDRSELDAILDAHRSSDGSPDCVVAFSGGRDSSYGLHLLCAEFDMHPIAYTYDWGMVTDLARRNQARLCGQLGVEHIWISADIKAKRANIRRNVSAWLKNPDLGMIPLFMAGDKQFFWYANETMKNTNIPLMVFATNRLEKTDFKTGFLNIPPKMENDFIKPTAMAGFDKLNMIWQYSRRFAANPRYFNKSIPDTLFAFWSYYAIKQDHAFIFDYLDWDEEESDALLIGTYDWEKAKDTDTTWRIGDGTAPFYNYIYKTVAGFSEYDTFRANQVREGIMSREDALARVEKENQPRWQSIREYCQMINIDFDETIRIIDRIPKLYC
jgi:glutamine---fructose-6-phosphate transaminase (isomerizing)